MLNDLIIPAKDLTVVRNYEGHSNQLGHHLKSSTWDPNNPPAVAILGIPEGRGSSCHQLAEAPDAIRSQLYTLATFPSEINIVDLGNIKTGNELKDTHAAVKIVAEELALLNVRLLILGGSQEFTVPIIRGFGREDFDLIVVDDRIDAAEENNNYADEFFINKLPVGTSVTILGGQSYFIGEQMHELVTDDAGAEIRTLGEIRTDIKELEPLIRKSDLMSFDYGAMNAADSPGQYRISPNGLTGAEACQISWYCGISTKPAWFALFGYAPNADPLSLGAMMAAQISWYFINGVSKRLDEEPVDEATHFEHYHMTVDGLEDPITFLLHPISRRWWMEVPSEDCTIYPFRVPCSKKDYRMACKNEISEKWWKYFNKI